jgi:uncharacterized membrane protein YgcG
MATTLTPTQRYAAGALLALALRQAQIHQSVLLGAHHHHDDDDEEQGRTSTSSGGGGGSSSSSSNSGAGADADLWTHDSHGLLRPVFRCFLAPLRL